MKWERWMSYGDDDCSRCPREVALVARARKLLHFAYVYYLIHFEFGVCKNAKNLQAAIPLAAGGLDIFFRSH
jgi:hypothetical protein